MSRRRAHVDNVVWSSSTDCCTDSRRDARSPPFRPQPKAAAAWRHNNKGDTTTCRPCLTNSSKCDVSPTSLIVVLILTLVMTVLSLYRTQCARHEQLLKQLGCSSLLSNSTDCQRQAVSISSSLERQRVLSQQIAAHRNAALQRSLQDPPEYRVFQTHHPAFVPLDPQFAPRPDEWDVDAAIPDIAIVGLAKAGMTQLWRLLTSHPDATHFGVSRDGKRPRKEYCLPLEWDKFIDWVWEKEPIDTSRTNATKKQVFLQSTLYWYYKWTFFNDTTATATQKPDGNQSPPAHRNMQAKTTTTTNTKAPPRPLTVNACYHNWDVEITRHYLLPFAKRRDQKYIVLFRDPADLLWSAYNFWKIPGLDRGVEEGWAEDSQDYRSPELFHELLLAGNRTARWWDDIHEYMRMESVRSPRKLIGMFGRERVLLLRNEDMLPSVVAQSGGALDRLCQFTGLQRSKFHPSSYSNVANCNDNAMKNCGTSRSSAYRIAGNREMLPESRTLIYLHFWEECKIWARDFDIMYPDCLNVMESTTMTL